MLSKKRRDLPRVDRFPGHLGGGVVPARQPYQIQFDSLRPDFIDYLMRQVKWKSQIVTRGYKAHGTLLHVAQTWNERHGTNRRPEFTQLVDRQIGFDSGADVLRRNSLPDHVGDITRNVIENTDVDRRVVREHEKSNT